MQFILPESRINYEKITIADMDQAVGIVGFVLRKTVVAVGNFAVGNFVAGNFVVEACGNCISFFLFSSWHLMQ